MSKKLNLRNLFVFGISGLVFLTGFKIGQHQVRKEEKEDVEKRSFRKYILIRRNEESN